MGVLSYCFLVYFEYTGFCPDARYPDEKHPIFWVGIALLHSLPVSAKKKSAAMMAVRVAQPPISMLM